MKKLIIVLVMVLGLVLPLYAKAETKSLNLKEALEEEQIELDKAFETYTENDDQATIYLFRGNGCGYCRAFLTFLNSIVGDYGKYFKVVSYEVWYNEDNSNLMASVSKYMGEEAQGVPYIVIGDKVFAGYAETYDTKIKDAIKELYDTNKNSRYDVMNKLKEDSNKKEEEKKEEQKQQEENNKKINTFSATLDEQESKIKTNSTLLIIFIILSAINFIMMIIILIVFSIKINKLKKEKNA